MKDKEETSVMASGRFASEIRRVRGEVLVALSVVYPGSLQAGSLMRSLLVLFPALEFEHVKRDLYYLIGKGYVERVVSESEGNHELTQWRNRWFRLTPRGLEVADRTLSDPALEE